MTIGSTLKFQRKNYGISQGELAEKLHISRQSISNWENDKSYPSLDNLLALSELYRISIDDLLKDNEKMRDEIRKNEQIIENYEKKIFNTEREIAKLSKKDNKLFSSKEELALLVSLIILGILWLPWGPILPIKYYQLKKKRMTI